MSAPILLHPDTPTEYRKVLAFLLAGDLPLAVMPGAIDGRPATVLCAPGPDGEVIPMAVLLGPRIDAGRVTFGEPATPALHTGLYL